MVTDPISDLIIRLKNGSNAKKPIVSVPYSKFVENVAHALKKAGYVESVEKKGKDFDRTVEIGMIYAVPGGARIHDVERISKSSRRVYQKATDIRTYRSGFGNTFYSTPKGVLTDMEAKRIKVGGEVLFKSW
ncbi:MAG: 30S ribosomal protein S8 [Candidatus Taylorbacteria bacterium]|nr:30S ribosomal protein S8 [Candidatus Taylorbacteria bacterium]